MYKVGFLAGMLLFCTTFRAQELRLNELMSTNVSVVADEDGEFTDWVELFNPGETAVQLEGYFLSDDTADMERWTFPVTELGPGEYLLVFCSGKDRVPLGEHYETVIRRGDRWNYRIGDSEPPADWYASGFDDKGWLSGPSGFGYGDGDDETEVGEGTRSIYVRNSFEIEDTSKVNSAWLHVDFDDGFVAYLNGTEIARSHLGEPGWAPAFDEAAELHEALMYEGMPPERFPVDPTLLTEGENVLAIQVNNESQGSSDMTLIPYFTLGLDESPQNPLGSPPELGFSGSGLHTSFRLSAGGETLILSDSSGSLLDSITFGPLPQDISYGRSGSDAGQWLYFEDPTPGGVNDSSGIEDVADGVLRFIPDLKFFSGSLDISVSGDFQGGEVRYTTDGSVPGEDSPLYSGALEISTTTIIRARIFKEGELPGKTYSFNYISRDDIDADNIPVISISTDPDNLWNSRDGLFEHAENRELEKPAHFEFIEPDGSVGFSIDAGLKIFGNEPSGGDHQHKLSIFARSKYGYGSIDYHLFPDKTIEAFESVVLRNPILGFWDVVASRLIDTTAVSKQSYRPVIVFINGEYWGTKFLREKINEHFVAANFGVDPDSVDLLMGIESPVEYYNEEWPIAGDLENYKELVHYLIDHDLSDSANYAFITDWIDIDNFITYWASEIYFGNIDWPGNNTKWWRERNEDGIYRWILFDVDAGMGAWEGPGHNTVIHATEPDGPSQWPNPPWSTFIVRKLLENQGFRDQFVLRSFDLLSTDLTEERVNRELDMVVSETEQEIRNHTRRWWGSYREWEENVMALRSWSKARSGNVRNHLKAYFDLGATRNLKLLCSPQGGGQVRVNSKVIGLFPWVGKYTGDLPLYLEAIPAYGYTFAGWEGTDETERSISVTLDQSVDLTARFEPAVWYEPVFFNEINYHSSDLRNPDDWVELYNNGTEPVDLSGWILKDSDDAHAFIFPASTTLEPGGFLVVCSDRNLFGTVHPEVDPVLGDMGFGLSGGGEVVRLFNREMELIDWVKYDDFTPWPLEADGMGATLALDHPDLDNSDARNWYASLSGGTPGLENNRQILTTASQGPARMQIQEPWPNPFREMTHISYRVEKQGRVQVAVYDLQGRMVVVLSDNMKSTGEYTDTWHAAGYPPGIYFCVVRSATSSIAKKLILMK